MNASPVWIDLLPFTFSKPEAEKEFAEESEEEVLSEEEGQREEKKKEKGVEGIIEIENPNLAKPKKMLKPLDIDIEKTSELSRREREEIEKQRCHERRKKLQEQEKTEVKQDLERLSLVRLQRAEAAKKREEEKSAKEEKKVQSRKPFTKK